MAYDESVYHYNRRVQEIVRRRSDVALHSAPTAGAAAATAGGAWLHRPGQLLVAPDAYDDVAAELSRLRIPVRDQRDSAGTRAVVVDGPSGVPELVERLEDTLGASGRVGPNHVFVAAPWTAWGPAGEPRELSALSWQPVDSSDGEGVRVAVVDTGLLPERQGWLNEGVLADADDIEDADVDDNGYIDPIAGHGTFIAGVIRRWAPRATIVIEKALDSDGLCDEATLARQIDEALDGDPHILNLSLGAYTRRSEAPIGLAAVWRRIEREERDVVVVSAAGNDGVDTPFWPAATKTSIGVGAVDASGGRAEFSNYGPWVDVWADGCDIESAFASGRYQPQDGSAVRAFEGICTWSGTSFATPLVAALIAVRMSRDGVSAVEARKRVLADANHVKDVGRVMRPG
jgi:subtilisin family serine protease